MNRRGILIICAAVISGWLVPVQPVHAVRIKLATKAPENFASSKIIKQMTEEIDKNTGGQVNFKIYYGGVKGTGRDLLLKIKSHEIQGGEFTAGEAASVCSDLRIPSNPLTFSGYDELDFVMQRMEPIFEAELDQAGFVVLGWIEMGFAYLMSSEPIGSLADLKGKKIWIPTGDPVGKAAFEAMGVSPTQYTISDVMVALQTGQINTVANSFVGAIALQWNTKVKFITDRPLLYVYGLTMITKQAWDEIPAEYRDTVRKCLANSFGILKTDIRKSNTDARGTLQKQGIQFVPVSPAHYQEMAAVIDKVTQELAGKEFSAGTMQKMQQFLNEYRTAHPNP
jgi:TRAP-type transport system periplasmic protein